MASACAPSGSLNTLNVNEGSVPNTAFTIQDSSDLIGGPMATGRVGDILLENDTVRLIIEQPGKTPWVGNFGGGIVDADLVRPGKAGQDNFGFMHPLVNVEWSLNVFDYVVIKDGSDGGEKIFRTYGVIDVYDYLDLDFLSPVAEAMTDQKLYFSPQFDDMNDPFRLTGLSSLNTVVVTDYTLMPGESYVKIETTFENLGDEDLNFPVGEIVNGGGEVMFLIPGLGFTPEMTPQIQGDTPALIYVGFDGVDVSYGYFFEPSEFMGEDEEGEKVRNRSTSLSYSGVTGILLGEDFLKVLPLGNKGEPKVNFVVPANDHRTITRYLVIGDGDGGSVFDKGLEILGIKTNSISGTVKDSSGNPVPLATVAVMNEDDGVIVTYRTDHTGMFSGNLSTGTSMMDETFGNGKYKLTVYKKGYKLSDLPFSGTCDPEEIDISSSPVTDITCTLGPTGFLEVIGGVIDEDTGQNIPARMTIVGYQPSYRSETGGYFEDKIIFERPLGVVDVYYVNAKGTIGLEELSGVRIAPGKYEVVFTRGVEYSMVRVPITVGGGGAASIGPISLKKVVDTSGYISGDFHLHSIVSPDSAMRPERRVLAAAGEGMDVLLSSDHDYLLDYKPYVAEISGRGLVKSGTMTTIAGQEISPNHMGHFIAFPLEVHSDRPSGGAIDWGVSDVEIMGPDPDFVMSPQDTVDHLRGLPQDPIIQVNHISDMATSLFLICGWVTSPFYYDSFGVKPLSSYADPGTMRVKPTVNAANYPYEFGESELVVSDYDTIELVIGAELHDNFLLTSSLPSWFNLLNLGLIKTATGDSDSHREIANPIGAPRNFVLYDTDPNNDMGSFDNFDMQAYTKSIRDHHVIVTTGPFVKAWMVTPDGQQVGIGDTAEGSDLRLRVDVTSPEWAWFDTIDIYINTEPIPADDEHFMPLEGAAKDPAEFYKPYHVPRYYYQPTRSFSLKEKTLENWENEDGLIKASIDIPITFDKDAWIVIFVRGTEGTEGYRSLFPYITHALVDADNPSVQPEDVDVTNVDMLTLTGAPAWAFTNPIFVDVDGDGFEALYSKQWDLSTSGLEYKGSGKTSNTKSSLTPKFHSHPHPHPKSATHTNSHLLK